MEVIEIDCDDEAPPLKRRRGSGGHHVDTWDAEPAIVSEDGFGDVSLLVLDPLTSSFGLQRCLRENSRWQQMVKRGLHTLQRKDYQVRTISCVRNRGPPSSAACPPLSLARRAFVRLTLWSTVSQVLVVDPDVFLSGTALERRKAMCVTEVK